MTKIQAKLHAQHMCDVFPTDGEHIGVISRIYGDTVTVSGHPEYGTARFNIKDLSTSCKIKD